jgi:hypothetical protein
MVFVTNGLVTHFRRGRHKNKKHLFYFGLIIPLPIQIQLLDNENPRKTKIDSLCTAETHLRILHIISDSVSGCDDVKLVSAGNPEFENYIRIDSGPDSGLFTMQVRIQFVYDYYCKM